ncbi:MAG: energy transducer TonB [Woeseiaceae bacterium]
MMRNSTATIALVLIATQGAVGEDATVSRFIDEDGDRVPKHTFVPVYPEKARRDRLEGDVQICYDVDRKGRPFRVAVRSSTHRIFEKPALRAVRASTYVALKEGESSSGIKTCRTFRFRLEPDERPAIDSVDDTG